ncbi:MAG: hypothetical protein LBV47_01480 [Bacteroidales bacterium]|jgi:enamine deaminase RidA (YjgF/YER057c/UK114 family)|nr:hypothetical protein [Bacteroidales bacterium]
MKYTSLLLNDFSVDIRFSSFKGECHVMIEGNNTFLNAETQYSEIKNALKHLTKNVLPHAAKPVLKRWFVSDAVNHRTFIQNEENVAVSIVQQPPLNGTKVALWVYFVENAHVTPNGENAIVMEHSAYRHLFDMQMHNHNPSEFKQTEEILNYYSGKLEKQGCTLADNAVRTWFFIQSVDTHYAGMVEARKMFFKKQGLTEHTHYIASTGIEGKYIHPETTVLMDAYAIAGVAGKQITYLKGASHLNQTHEYGVTFERATTVDYGDRRHIFVSGTASINNRGQILFSLDVCKQIGRTLENISVLLNEGGATMADVAQMIVYLRDTADYHTVLPQLEATCPNIPKVIVWAPVCRPAWLIEIECIAICEAGNSNYAAF